MKGDDIRGCELEFVELSTIKPDPGGQGLGWIGLIDSSTRGVWSLTEKGRSTQLSPDEAVALFNSIHKQFSAERKKTKAEKPEEDENTSPEVIVHRTTLMGTLLDLPPDGFERLCQR